MALYRKLNRETRVRKSILSGLTKSVLEFGYVETTEQRAKEARKFVEKMIRSHQSMLKEMVDILE